MTNPFHAVAGALTAALAFGYPGGLASAQGASKGPVLEIIVEAPRSVPLPRQHSSFTGAPVVTTTVSIPVRYDDLDLANPGDRARFLTRVERVAQDACKELDRLHPLDPDPDCARKTVANGMAAASATLAAVTAGP